MSCSEKCPASTQDMSGKMFIFPQQTATAHVKMTPKQENFTAVTVCHRTFTDLTRNHVLFSLNTPGQDNSFLTWVNTDRSLSTYVLANKIDFHGVDYSSNKWHSICSTWDSATGLTQMWLDGQPLTIKYTTEKPITGKPIVTLGQTCWMPGDFKESYGVSLRAPWYPTGLRDIAGTSQKRLTGWGQQKEQDSHGGGFEAKQCFVGMMTDVHMWDYVVSPCEIQKFMKGQSFKPGNVLNWAELDCEVNGRVMIEDTQTGCTCFN